MKCKISTPVTMRVVLHIMKWSPDKTVDSLPKREEEVACKPLDCQMVHQEYNHSLKRQLQLDKKMKMEKFQVLWLHLAQFLELFQLFLEVDLLLFLLPFTVSDSLLVWLLLFLLHFRLLFAQFYTWKQEKFAQTNHPLFSRSDFWHLEGQQSF